MENIISIAALFIIYTGILCLAIVYYSFGSTEKDIEIELDRISFKIEAIDCLEVYGYLTVELAFSRMDNAVRALLLTAFVLPAMRITRMIRFY